jgi:hypothetical protein
VGGGVAKPLSTSQVALPPLVGLGCPVDGRAGRWVKTDPRRVCIHNTSRVDRTRKGHLACWMATPAGRWALTAREGRKYRRPCAPPPHTPPPPPAKGGEGKGGQEEEGWAGGTC